MKRADTQELFVCMCSSAEHQMIVRYDHEDWPFVNIHIHLTKGSFWSRLTHGIKYIFGHQSRYGAFDEVCLEEPEVSRLIELLQKWQKIMEKDNDAIRRNRTKTTGILSELSEGLDGPVSETSNIQTR